MSKLSISIAICTYNGERFLQEQLDSIAAQTRRPDEVVVGDDGSTDSTLIILEQWAKDVPFPVRITRNEKNLGFAKNFEATMLRCTGDVIFPCDQDDVWLPEKLEKMTAVFENQLEAGLVFCNAQHINAEGKLLPGDMAKDAQCWLRYGMPMFVSIQNPRKNPINVGCCCAIRKNLLTFIFPIPQGWYHDMWFYALMPALAQTRTLFDPLILHRCHGNNISQQGGTWILEGAKNNFRSSVRLFELYRPQMEQLQERLKSFPESPVRQRHLRFLNRVTAHFTVRSAIQRDFVAYFFLWLWGVVSLRYFWYNQPIKSMLFDMKEGVLSKES